MPVERQSRPVRPARDPREPHGARKGDWALFRLNVGSTKNADPRWLIPLLCKRGGITRHEIGAIRISFRDTTVEIAAHVADKFAGQARRPSSDPRDKHIRIEPFRSRATPVRRRP